MMGSRRPCYRAPKDHINIRILQTVYVYIVYSIGCCSMQMEKDVQKKEYKM